jgi:pSer/pThr/pTyr-binding forkhead associated (FHA) protein
VLLEEDDDLTLGEFGIATRMIQPRRAKEADAPAPKAAPAATRIYQAAPAATEAVSSGDADRLGLAHDVRATLRVAGTHHELGEQRIVLGRSRECDITIDDPNVSRRHAEIRRENGVYWIVDLKSTNGIEVNGERVQRARLAHADTILMGKTELTFEHAG